MTDNIWTSYAERRPTKKDADIHGDVIVIVDDGTMRFRQWDYAPEEVVFARSWANPDAVLRATGYVKPRKLHPAWRELRADSWGTTPDDIVPRFVWLYSTTRAGDEGPWRVEWEARRAIEMGFTHWQPCDPPPVWEDE